MRTTFPFSQILKTAGAGALLMCVVSACKPSPPPSGLAKGPAVKAKPAAVSTNQAAPLNASAFVELMAPKGRDPFFPNSNRRDPVPASTGPSAKPAPAAEVALKGIVGDASHRLAVINNAILEPGETGSVRVTGGRIKVKCMEIGSDFAVVLVEGEIQSKRLQLNKKGF
ncbi:MAG TPA: hypothetical protein VGO59_02830 [Verrucomicrobiae bacterium]|jgi:hypothetical protein